MGNPNLRKPKQQSWHEAQCAVCGAAFTRARRNKTTCGEQCKRAMTPRDLLPCSAPDCEKKANRVGHALCEAHYAKLRRYGTVSPEPRESTRVDLTGMRFGALIVLGASGEQWECLCDCGNTRTTFRWNLESQGDANACGDHTRHRRRPAIGYYGLHTRIEKDRGKASLHACVDCGERAKEWSYDYNDPEELVHPDRGYVLTYSLDTSNYSPRCKSCHSAFDKQHRARGATHELERTA